ncbi:hypothetical protein L861_20230 [Litchfieldella anticariensis FP35 = DSM 16096]|uniref:Uncharacterized protein n=1 Tax=Litchfieldella anticariensis (strain DSM 16096 / CECT 5854 / CIP 108499 / LMG 22089 / FP35) TaxID=1121939 RepID=S2KIN0_LITA3|nr:hypothetical protein [Halomonas anticariensis]EPC01982.1 hypothetical protein L861_20230 [Halomonas anticariensis FP35 = DSM 16096]
MHATHESSTHRDTHAWQSALDRALAAHDDVVALAHYSHVANAFPSSSPNPYTQEHPLLDYRKLKAWAIHRGWYVRPAPERASQEEKYRPPVRFTRQPRSLSQRTH